MMVNIPFVCSRLSEPGTQDMKQPHLTKVFSLRVQDPGSNFGACALVRGVPCVSLPFTQRNRSACKQGRNRSKNTKYLACASTTKVISVGHASA